MTFANAVNTQKTTTTNGMDAYTSTGQSLLDLFYFIGASRGNDITPHFAAAFAEDQEIATKILLWARDVRGGAGEREIFRKMLNYVENSNVALAKKIAKKIPEIGRFDDLFYFKQDNVKKFAFEIYRKALLDNNGLAAKWCPREKSAKSGIATEFRNYLGLTPKQYRKMLTGMTSVVETQMCSNKWNEINYNHVPSIASARYRKAFKKHSEEKYAAYVEALTKNDGSAKVNANAIFPHDVLKSVSHDLDEVSKNFIDAQWNALPNYIGDAKILPVVDVSSSMAVSAGKSSTTCMHVAISLGLYCAQKNTGVFAGVISTFSEKPNLVQLKGKSVVEMYHQLKESDWGMSTNIIATFKQILKVAIDGKVSQSDMPTRVMIFSDMQFDQAINCGTAFDNIKQMYSDAGYELPKLVFWNLNGSDNVPVPHDQNGVSLVSGFNTSIIKNILANEDVNPMQLMLEVVNSPRYSL